MVAMFETREATAVRVGKIDAAGVPVTFVLIDSDRLVEPVQLSTLKVFATVATPEGEPTWEDAAWQ